MRHARLFRVATVFLCFTNVNAEEQQVGFTSCPIPEAVVPVRYERLHQIPTKAVHGDVTHKIVTPGGMVLDTPRMVAAVDALTIVARDQDAMCFGLLTVSRERHRCEFTGVARSEAHDTFLFREGDVVVRFTFVEGDKVRVEPVGTGYRKRCESSGEIQPAIYARRASAG